MLRTLVRQAASSTAQVGRSASGAGIIAGRTRLSTDICGVDVHPTPLTALQGTYASTLSVLESLPAESVYKQAATAITTQRLNIVKRIAAKEAEQGRSPDNEEAVVKLEEELDAGLVEEVLGQAEHELKLAAKMIDWKP